jgi:hypothetical protein
MPSVRVRSVLLVLGALLVVTGALDLASGVRYGFATRDWPVDFDINWVAARRLVEGESMYDRATSRREGEELIGREMRFTGRDAFSSYIGSPAVALTHVPFAGFDNYQAAQLYRMLSFVMMIAAIVLTAWALAPPARAPAALIGVGLFFWTFPMVKSLSLGQGTGFVMLSLALGIWAAARERWTLAGVALGVATVLKVSPVLLLVYLVVRCSRRVLVPAVMTVVVTLGAAAAIGRPADVVTWIRDVSPQVSKGTISAYNQSVVGALARLTTGRADLSSHAGPGLWYLLGYVLWGVAVFALWRACRHRAFDPLELGILVLVALLAGPLTWDHYYAWALLPAVLLVDPVRWRGRARLERALLLAGVVAAAWLCRDGIPLPSPAAVRADWFLRLETVPYATAAVVLLAVSARLLTRPGGATPVASECDDDRAAAVGAARPVVAAGVHGRG